MRRRYQRFREGSAMTVPGSKAAIAADMTGMTASGSFLPGRFGKRSATAVVQMMVVT